MTNGAIHSHTETTLAAVATVAPLDSCKRCVQASPFGLSFSEVRRFHYEKVYREQEHSRGHSSYPYL